MQRSGGAAIRMQCSSKLLKFRVGDLTSLEKMQEVPSGKPFCEERMLFLDKVSKILLSDVEARRYPDVITFAFWIRKSNMLQKMEELFCRRGIRMGRGVVFHIAPSNIAVNYAYSLAVGFVLGNANIVRLPSKEFPQVDVINRAILKALECSEFQKWKNYIILLHYERNKKINDFLSSICDVRVIWGGDASISEIRKSALLPRAGEVTFADRFSVCVIDAKVYQKAGNPQKIAADFYNDTYLTDQNACTSPRLVCWLGDASEIQLAKEVFWGSLHKAVCEKYQFQPIQFVDKWTNCCRAAVRFPGSRMIKMEDNRIVRVQLGCLEEAVQEYSGNSGFFFEYDLKDIMELAPVCNAKLQTVSYLGNKGELIPLIESGMRGIDRVTEIGKTMDFDFLWDGYNLIERLTREVWMQ